jgi:hypothetical protein
VSTNPTVNNQDKTSTVLGQPDDSHNIIRGVGFGLDCHLEICLFLFLSTVTKFDLIVSLKSQKSSSKG